MAQPPHLPPARIVEVSEIIAGWDADQRETFAYYVGQHAPELVDGFDEFLRSIERRQAAREVNR